VQGNIRHGFVYERVPHITLKSIANNAEIDVIWDQWQAKLEPLREQLNASLKKSWAEWEIPREADATWPEPAKRVHADWWQARIARQKEIDASIAAKADTEYLYDQPYEDRTKVRVAGPFTVESLSPHRVPAVDVDDSLFDELEAAEGKREKLGEGAGGETADFVAMVLDYLKKSGVQQSQKADRLVFTSLKGWPGRFLCAEGRVRQKSADAAAEDEAAPEKRAAILVGPEYGTVSRADLVAG
jgi:adenine-specific DNA-methyltransferase